MKKSRKEDFWCGKIKYDDREEEIKDPAHVEQKIREAQNEIAGAGTGISDTLISLEVTSTNVPDLTLIDLPGITRVAVKGQPEDIGEQSKRLIRKFISKQDTINLVVVPCNVDIATTEALKMAQEVDPKGERTLGILTKPDLVDKGTEETLVSIINNEMVYLNKGYMIVRCRGQQEIKDCVALNEALKTERDFFEGHPHFGTLYDKGIATIPNLAEKLTLELVFHIKRCLPRLEEQIHVKLSETQAELDCYGPGSPKEPEQRIYFLTDKITAFIQDVLNLTTGEEVKSMSYMNIFPDLRKQFALWKKDLDSVGETFNKKIDKDMQMYEEKYRGRELPGFLNYKTFEVIVKSQIKQLEEPAIKRLKEISGLIRNHFSQLAHSHFKAFPNIVKMAKTKIDNIKLEKEKETESMLRTQFNMEMMIYTQDKMYNDNLQNIKEGEKDRQKPGVARGPSHRLYNQSDNEGILEELTCKLKVYFSIMTKRLADQVPMVIRYMVLQESAAQLQREMLQLIQDKHNIDELLEEDHDIAWKWNNLHSRQKRLTEALKYLAKF